MTVRTEASPFGSAEPAEWSQPALAIATIATSFLEPDPGVEWTEDRLPTVRRELMSPELPTADE